MKDKREPLVHGSNGNGRATGLIDDETRKLRSVLKRAILKEEAPESLRMKIRKMIRENQ